ncbi:MAG TPA: hypothetical protein VN848_12975 [Gemmatimonadales bacterium]|nr:hypothetical protein [Gemmatimonadales bacterium]
MPPWTGVVSAISLTIIALSALAVAAAAVGVALAIRAMIRLLQGKAAPALDDIQHVVATVRGEVDALAATAQSVRARVSQGTDAAAARLAELDALVEVVQNDVRAAAEDLAATLRTVRRAVSLLDWGALFAARRARTKRRRKD